MTNTTSTFKSWSGYKNILKKKVKYVCRWVEFILIFKGASNLSVVKINFIVTFKIYAFEFTYLRFQILCSLIITISTKTQFDRAVK